MENQVQQDSCNLKRTAEEADSLLEGVKALIVDIEGTTTPIDFVKVKNCLSMLHLPHSRPAFYKFVNTSYVSI